MGQNRVGEATRRLKTLGLLLATTVATACQTTVNGLDLPERSIDGITYRVTSLTVAESFPVQIGLTVELENESATRRSVLFPDGCVVLMRAYDGGTEPVWDMGDLVACTLVLVEVDLAPGETREFEAGLVSAATILGDSLPDGEYRITAYLRPGQIVEVEAGVVELAVP